VITNHAQGWGGSGRAAMGMWLGFGLGQSAIPGSRAWRTRTGTRTRADGVAEVMGGEAIPTPTPGRTGDRVRVPPFGLSTSTKAAEPVLTTADTKGEGQWVDPMVLPIPAIRVTPHGWVAWI
jgi:hypothetical protein